VRGGPRPIGTALRRRHDFSVPGFRSRWGNSLTVLLEYIEDARASNEGPPFRQARLAVLPTLTQDGNPVARLVRHRNRLLLAKGPVQAEGSRLAMKALSIRQPWAWLIIAGHKDIENRSWGTKYRAAWAAMPIVLEEAVFRDLRSWRYPVADTPETNHESTDHCDCPYFKPRDIRSSFRPDETDAWANIPLLARPRKYRLVFDGRSLSHTFSRQPAS